MGFLHGGGTPQLGLSAGPALCSVLFVGWLTDKLYLVCPCLPSMWHQPHLGTPFCREQTFPGMGEIVFLSLGPRISEQSFSGLCASSVDAFSVPPLPGLGTRNQFVSLTPERRLGGVLTEKLSGGGTCRNQSTCLLLPRPEDIRFWGSRRKIGEPGEDGGSLEEGLGVLWARVWRS